MAGEGAVRALATLPKPIEEGRRSWKTVSFPSTLHLHTVIDILMAQIPADHQPEVRLGLQEALVNAAKHGNDLDPHKSVSVRYRSSSRDHCWIIRDEGRGFSPPTADSAEELESVPCEYQECGRGLFILNQVFDEVCWNNDGTALTLYKRHQPARSLATRSLAFAGCVRS